MITEPDRYVDAAFLLRGTSLPLDHGYLLFASLSKIIAEFHERPTWGIHPVRGVRMGPGELRLTSDSSLKLRLPAAELGAILPLAGKVLDVADHRVAVGVPRLFPLIPVPTLRARFVTIKKFHEAPAEFLNALRRQLAAIEGLGQDPERIEVQAGERRVMRVSDHTIVGFPVVITGLEATASLAIQRHGLGGRRHMGAGIFVPPGRRG